MFRSSWKTQLNRIHESEHPWKKGQFRKGRLLYSNFLIEYEPRVCRSSQKISFRIKKGTWNQERANCKILWRTEPYAFLRSSQETTICLWWNFASRRASNIAKECSRQPGVSGLNPFWVLEISYCYHKFVKSFRDYAKEDLSNRVCESNRPKVCGIC